MSRIVKTFSLALVALIAVAGLAACSGTSVEKIDMSNVTAVIDVRTPGEYTEGHLEGAANVDWQSPQFMEIMSQLPTDGTYIIYCKSGNRAGQAIQALEAEGFTNLTNAGSLQDASTATGLPIVK